MRKSRSTEEKIIAVLAEQERGIGTAEVCRNTGLAVRHFTNGRRNLAGSMSPRRAS